MHKGKRGRQFGAALLTAMLTVTLVATFAAAALWQQWRAAEVEAAERGRTQAAWVLVGALDWSRLILREDARAAGSSGVNADYLAEPWAIPLEEAKLTTFLAADKNIASDALEGLPDAFLSGRIIDAQSKLNAFNLVDAGKPVATSVAAFKKLFQLLGLPAEELALMTANLQRALPAAASTAATGTTGTTGTTSSASSTASTSTPQTTTPTTTAPTTVTGSATGPLVPQRTAQLVWLGLSPSTAAALEPYVTVLPTRTPLNLNTASAEAIFASTPALDLAGAKRLVAARTQSYFKTLADAGALVQQSSAQFVPDQHSVSTTYFEVQARLRIDRTWVEEQTLLQRVGINVGIVWRERGAGATPQPARS
ncbi:type II secretion system minor pseudopilin GspK [Variovorax sp. J31P207]|uniref:type II secretion system minor pseudopilin GspK n=1 Tax=Variovorax sp. J31P207 TaxID=3053510 RepID=UPI002577F854|nr:type II secretion system minor pseudopilin GspK [Variovorax sp. J31P207]MDM0068694.1 type II secretion system minor pseudopilin GspK [Variovorax sp. J31P207]